jgi:hypothetical protein
VGTFENPLGVHSVQFGGDGNACEPTPLPIVNEWDYVRYGTISYGERVVASDPPEGLLDARKHADLDCFAVTFDSPNYVYVNEIAVETTSLEGGPEAVAPPQVTATRRGDESETAAVNGVVVNRNAPETVEIVLDRPIPMGATTRFTISDGTAVNVIEYTFAPGDADGDGRVTLRELAYFQTCFGQSSPAGACLALDLTRNGSLDLADYAAAFGLLSGP